jgi:hypothetical protein
MELSRTELVPHINETPESAFIATTVYKHNEIVLSINQETALPPHQTPNLPDLDLGLLTRFQNCKK